MMFHLLMLGAVFATHQPPCASPGARQAHIHWSDRKTVVSPDCRWSVQVTPLPGDSDGLVTLKDNVAGLSRPLFRLERDGALYWGPDGTTLLVENREAADNYRLMLYSPLGADESDSTAFAMDRIVLSDIEHRLREQPEIELYYPRFVAFTGGAIVVAVGVVTDRAQPGPSTAQCFGYSIAISPLGIQRRIDKTELKRRYGASCDYAE
jgi:hypothetical protein